jgi:hypothetical protein
LQSKTKNVKTFFYAFCFIIIINVVFLIFSSISQNLVFVVSCLAIIILILLKRESYELIRFNAISQKKRAKDPLMKTIYKKAMPSAHPLNISINNLIEHSNLEALSSFKKAMILIFLSYAFLLIAEFDKYIAILPLIFSIVFVYLIVGFCIKKLSKYQNGFFIAILLGFTVVIVIGVLIINNLDRIFNLIDALFYT